mgnify:CR=1 FL=1
MKKVARTILICIYFIITILITYCLLSYNKYNVSEFKDKYLLVLKENNKYYHKSDLLIIKKQIIIKKEIQYFIMTDIIHQQK